MSPFHRSMALSEALESSPARCNRHVSGLGVRHGPPGCGGGVSPHYQAKRVSISVRTEKGTKNHTPDPPIPLAINKSMERASKNHCKERKSVCCELIARDYRFEAGRPRRADPAVGLTLYVPQTENSALRGLFSSIRKSRAIDSQQALFLS